jgi:hypothetical protein
MFEDNRTDNSSFNKIDNGSANDQNINSEHPDSNVDTSNWIVYSNTKFGYELKYPNDWLGAETSNMTDYAIFYRANRDVGMSGSFLAVRIFKKDQFLTLAQWWEQKDNEDGAKYEFLGETKIDNFTAYKYHEIGGMREYHTVFTKNNDVYDVFGITTENIYLEFVNNLKFNN